MFISRLNNELMKPMVKLENYNLKLINSKVFSFSFQLNFLKIILFLEKLADERNKCHQLQKMVAASSAS
jgi:hypothetical protein